MAHEKVYGICEDKCRVEVYPKANAYGNENVVCIDTQLVYDESSKAYKIFISLPSGFTIDNCVVLSAMYSEEKLIYYPLYLESNLRLEMDEDGIRITSVDIKEPYYIKLVLMKVV